MSDGNPWNRVMPAIALLACVVIADRLSHAGEVKESFDDGKLKLHYRTDGNNHKTGLYEEYYPSGKLKVRGSFTADKKSGRWQTFDEAGKVIESANYRNDLLDGFYVWNFPSGKPGLKAQYAMGQIRGPITALDEKGGPARIINYPQSRQALEKAFDALYPHDVTVKYVTEPNTSAPYKAGTLSPQTLEPALKLAQLYRFASGLHWEDLKLDPDLCDIAAHGAVVLVKLGMLTHTPQRPGDMDAAFFKLAYAGCSESNIAGSGNPVESVRMFMDDSDDSNIDLVGHRQWVLSPALQRIGLGCAGEYCCMHVFDGGRQTRIDFNFIAFPGEGYYPIQLMQPNTAWSIHFNNTRAQLGTPAATHVTLQKLDEHYQPAGDPIDAKVVSCHDAFVPEFGWSVLVFKPELTDLGPAKYWVSVTGVKTPAGADAPFGYLVDLFDPTAGHAPASAKKGE